MKKLLLTIVLFCSVGTLLSQNVFTAIIKDESTGEPLPYANVIVDSTKIGNSADEFGKVVITNIPNGKQELIFSYVGYSKKEKKYTFPLETKNMIIVFLEKDEELKTVTIASTRTNNRIEEIPTRIEVLGYEEVIEESGITPGNISKLLGETSGVNVQRTSAVSGNVDFRIQGLPGKYTQLLKNGFPSYVGFASGLSLLQIPPLDLKQVEIIKGSASTLYGGDAVAGIINLISKKPSTQTEFSILVNQTTLGGNDFSSFFSGKTGKYGFTIVTGFNTQKAKDVSGNNFTDVPKYNRAVVTPTLFININNKNNLIIGLTTTYENRLGGDINVVKNVPDSSHLFYEHNETRYLSGNITFTHTFTNKSKLTFRDNISNFNRTLKTNTNIFEGNQLTSFSEAAYLLTNKNHSWVSGINLYFDSFAQTQTGNTFSLDYNYNTIGIFSQDNWKISKKLTLEPGIRYDYNINNKGFILPRLAVMYKFSRAFSARLSGGLGYKLPTPFTDAAERTRYQNVIFTDGLKAEKSMGTNLDFTYKIPLFNKLFLTINQAFFMIQIANPIIENADSLSYQTVYYQNANGNLLNKGMSTNIRLSMDELVLYVDYSLINARKQYDKDKPLELTPKNRLTTNLSYENKEVGWKMGLEAFYIGHQYFDEGLTAPNYWLLGASTQKTIGHFTIALNVENILNIRQTHFENIVSGDVNNPVFSELYAPLDGIVGNVVLKFDLF